MAEYTGFVREVNGKDANGRKVRKGWQLVAKYKQDGAWRQKTRVCHARTKTAATKELTAWLEELNGSKAIATTPDTVTVAEALETFLGGWQVEPSTMATYRASAKHVVAGLGDIPLADLDPKQVRSWLGRLGKTYSESVCGKAYRLLNMVLKHAVLDGELPRNVCDAVKPPKRKDPDPNALTNANRERLVIALGVMEPTPVVTAAYIALYMGLRRGEICAMRWKNIDFAAKTMTVDSAIGVGKGGTYEKTPKTKRSRRTLPMPETVVAALERRRTHMRDATNDLDLNLDADEFGSLFVIGTLGGGYKDPTILGREWHSLAESLNLIGTKGRLCTLHGLRDSFATLAVANGTDVKSVSSYLGHSNAAMTLNTYASADPDALKRAAEKMEAANDFTGKAPVLDFRKTGTDN